MVKGKIMLFIFLIIIFVIIIAVECYLYYLTYSKYVELKANLESLRKTTSSDLDELWYMAGTEKPLTREFLGIKTSNIGIQSLMDS